MAPKASALIYDDFIHDRDRTPSPDRDMEFESISDEDFITGNPFIGKRPRGKKK